MCDDGPVVNVQPENIFYRNVRVEDVPALVQSLVDGVTMKKLLEDSNAREGANEDR